MFNDSLFIVPLIAQGSSVIVQVEGERLVQDNLCYVDGYDTTKFEDERYAALFAAAPSMFHILRRLQLGESAESLQGAIEGVFSRLINPTSSERVYRCCLIDKATNEVFRELEMNAAAQEQMNNELIRKGSTLRWEEAR